MGLFDGLQNRQCSIWICTTETEKECLERGLFGDQDKLEWKRKNVHHDDVCFLLNINTNVLWGVFIATTDARLDIDKTAWQGRFRHQVRVKCVTDKPQQIKEAWLHLQRIGIQPLSQGRTVPKYGTFGPDLTEKLLDLFKAAYTHHPAISHAEAAEPTHPAPTQQALRRTGFARVAGMKDVKEFVYERVVAPHSSPVLASRFRLRLGGGILLYGPPGTGKTLIARATADELNARLVEISPAIIEGFPGEAERKLSQEFEAAACLDRAVLLFDEADALLRSAPSGSTVMQRIVPTLKTLVERHLRDSGTGLVIMATTNRPHEIDEAFLRPGRFDAKIYVGLPDEQTRIELLRLELEGRPLHKSLMDGDEGLRKVAARLHGWSGADIAHLVDHVAYKQFQETRRRCDGKDETEIGDDEYCPITPEHLLASVDAHEVVPTPYVYADDLEEFRKKWCGP